MSDRRSYIAALAREMRDEERIFVGANQNDVALAAYLARSLWAPRLKLWAGGMAQLDRAQDLMRVGRGSYDRTLVGSRDATFWQARAFDDALRAPVVFAGGLQVDARGNANLAGVPAVDGGWRLRGPGSAGLPTLTALAERFFIAVPAHTPRSLVERCAALSVLGDPVAREAAGLARDALVAVVTPLARFEPTDEGLVLTEIADGVTRDELAERTGFAIRQVAEVGRRAPVSPEEAAALDRLEAAGAANRAAVAF
jgi:glutaconate CoA-transferase subunit B